MRDVRSQDLVGKRQHTRLDALAGAPTDQATPRRPARARRLLAALAMVASLVAVVPAGVGAAAGAPGHGPAPARPAVASGAFAIGDSVMLDAAVGLQRYGITVDAAVSRQFLTGIDILSWMRTTGRLPREVVVGLGTNGPFTSASFDLMMGLLRGRHVVFVTVREPRWWQGDVNATLRAGVARWPNARLADWYAISWNRPDWFWEDGIHLTPAGAAAYTQLVAHALW